MANPVLCALVAIAIAAIPANAQEDPCYTPTSDVGLEPSLASDVCSVNEALDMSPPDYATAREVYESGLKNTDTTLKSIATAEYGSPMYQKFAAFFNDPVWMDTLINQALDGEEPFTTDTKRVQMVKKLLQSSVLVQQTYYHMDSAMSSAEEGDGEAALVSWDKAMAAYYGDNVNCSPFGNAQSRGIEFATISEGVSESNKAVHTQFGTGATALADADVSEDELATLQGARDEIIRQITIIYIQSTFKYATLMDDGLEEGVDVEKFQSEGFAYYHAIYPFVDDVDSDFAQATFDAFDLAQEPDEAKAEAVKPGFREIFEDLGVVEEEINDFDGDRSDNYEAPDESSCEVDNPFAVVTTIETDRDR